MNLSIRKWVIFNFIFCALTLSGLKLAHAEDAVIKTIAHAQAKLDEDTTLALWDELRVNSRGETYRFNGIRIYHMDNFTVIDEGQAGDFMFLGRRVKSVGSIDIRSVTADEAIYSGKMVIGKKSYPFELRLTRNSALLGYHLSLSVDGPLESRDLDVSSGMSLILNP